MLVEISIHAPHARSDVIKSRCCRLCQFQSTLLMRGATRGAGHRGVTLKFQSTLLMRGATAGGFKRHWCMAFQSTLLMRGATAWAGFGVPRQDSFQSTLLMRGATCAPCHPRVCRDISIHAPHARSDGTGWTSPASGRHFNPRSSCEERR